MKIGLIGAQNSHSKNFCDIINKNHTWDDVIISYIYGADDSEQAKRLCEEFNLTECSGEDEVIEKSDAVVITYRKGSAHYQAVIKAIKAGKPVFNDKPFVTNIKEAEEIIALAKERGVLLSGGSGLKSLPEIAEIKESITAGSTVLISYAADIASEYDGYWFYGIHAVELCVELCGLDFISVQAFNNNGVMITNVLYADKLCVIATAPQSGNLTISVSNPNNGNIICRTVPMNFHSVGPSELVNMVKTGNPPRDYAYYLKSVELMSRIIETAGI